MTDTNGGNAHSELEANSQTKRVGHTKKIICIFITCAIILGLGISSYLYFKYNHERQQHLAQQIIKLQNETAQSHKKMIEQSAQIEALQPLANQVATISAQQAQLATEWQAIEKGNLDHWQIAEAHYFVKLANDRLQLLHQNGLAIILLQRAEKILQGIGDERLAAIRQSITVNLSKLQALPTIDINALYTRLHQTTSSLNDLPLLNETKNSNHPSTAAKNVSWWREGLENAWQKLRQVVIIRRLDSNALPLVMPDEKIFLYHNIMAQVDNAIWGLLHRDSIVYTTSLERAHTWIQRYFVSNNPKTQNVLSELEALQKIDIQTSSIDVSDTLALFDDLTSEPATSSAQ